MKKFCVIGYPIKHSKSPQIHHIWFDEFGIDAEFVAIEVKPEDLEQFIYQNFLSNKVYDGAAVTVPHKIEIQKFLENETQKAKKIGAVNTLFFENQKLSGTNTDADGALLAILAIEKNIKNKKVLIFGAGGASRAIIFSLKDAGCDVYIKNRTEEKAIKLAEEFGCNFLENENFTQSIFNQFDIIINATSVGLKTWTSVVPADFWSQNQIAFDVVYDPLTTKFLSDAKNAGAKIITGEKMLIYQAIAQFKIWHNLEPTSKSAEKLF